MSTEHTNVAARATLPRPRVWFVSELYYPEQTSTGYFLTGIAEALARHHPTGVICSQPTYAQRDSSAPRHETREMVEIHRRRGSRFNPGNLPGRLVNAITVTTALVLATASLIRRGDTVIVVTNPPALPLFVRIVCHLRGARPILLVHDVYPEVLFAAGLIDRERVFGRFLLRSMKALYRGFDQVVVLGRDMRDLIASKGIEPGRISVIPNWGETDRIHPRKGPAELRAELGGGRDSFVVQFMGNIGRTHALDLVLQAAELLKDDSSIHFQIIGAGSRAASVRSATKEMRNVTFSPPVEFADLEKALAAADVALVPLVAGMRGVSMPSRTYNVLAAGLPIIAVAEEGSELARLAVEERVGWVAAPDDPTDLARVIRNACSSESERAEMGARARALAEGSYSRHAVLSRWVALVGSLTAAKWR